ncbi:hypothetical protein [Nocardia australiensis]|nr:hypothetical protein [Nocardia australiensis]
MSRRPRYGYRREPFMDMLNLFGIFGQFAIVIALVAYYAWR